VCGAVGARDAFWCVAHSPSIIIAREGNINLKAILAHTK